MTQRSLQKFYPEFRIFRSARPLLSVYVYFVLRNGVRVFNHESKGKNHSMYLYTVRRRSGVNFPRPWRLQRNKFPLRADRYSYVLISLGSERKFGKMAIKINIQRDIISISSVSCPLQFYKSRHHYFDVNARNQDSSVFAKKDWGRKR